MHPTTHLLLSWYRARGRDLPWRGPPDPYRTWLSEIMLQQTRVEAVIPYFERFLVRFPTVAALAAAPLEEVLSAWAGLGYYRRARNLHRAAGQVVALGGFPDTVEGLRQLAGVGEYTAAAIASIAFGRDALAVDGNLRRVTARLAAIDTDPARGPGARAVRAWLEVHLPRGLAGDFNQALMDLGATICVPGAPHCGSCPLIAACAARAAGLEAELPRTAARPTPREVHVVALLAERAGAYLLVQRPDQGLLAGLWGPPDRVLADGEDPAAGAVTLRADLGLPASGALRSLGTVEHTFTHQRWRVEVLGLGLPANWERPGVRWWTPHGAVPPLSTLAVRLLERRDAVAEQGP